MSKALDRIKKAVEGKPRDTLDAWKDNKQPALCEVYPDDVIEVADALPPEKATDYTRMLSKGCKAAATNKPVMIQVDDAWRLIEAAN